MTLRPFDRLIARSLVARWELRSHFESGLGVALAETLPAAA